MECTVCETPIASVEHYVRHTKTEQHLLLEDKYKDLHCGISVTAFPPGTSNDDILNYFSQFGTIYKLFVQEQAENATIIFDSEHDAANVLRLVHHIKGTELIVRKSYPRGNLVKSDPKTEMHQLLLYLGQVKGLNNQIKCFTQFITPTRPHIVYKKIIEDVKCVLETIYSDIQVLPFGSTVTFLQSKETNVNLFVCRGERLLDEISDLITGENGLHTSDKFSDISFTPEVNAKVINCVHKQTAIPCIIISESYFPVKQSEFLEHYLNLDSNLRSVVLVLKYWLNINEIVDNSKLTNYSLTLMFIFFLQQRHQYPSIAVFQEDIPPKIDSLTAPWNCEFSKTYCPDIIKASISDMLQGFFQYYSVFPFNEGIMCPYLGGAIKRKQICSEETFPKALEIYKKNYKTLEPLLCNTPMCMLDPFEMNKNVLSNIDQNDLQKFKKECILANHLIHCNEDIILSELFTQKYHKRKPQTKIPRFSSLHTWYYTLEKKNGSTAVPAVNCSSGTNKSTKKASCRIQLKGDTEMTVLFKMPDNADYIERKLKKDLTKSKTVFEMWTDAIFNFLITLLEKVLKFDLIEFQRSKKPKLGNEKDVNDKGQVLHYTASCKWNVFVNRRKVQEIIHRAGMPDTILERQTKISDYIYNVESKKMNSDIFRCNIVLSANEVLKQVKVSFFQTFSAGKSFKIFFVSLGNVIKKWWEQFENELRRTKY